MNSQSFGVGAASLRENELVAVLLQDALANFDLDRSIARRRLEDAFSLVQAGGEAASIRSCLLTAWQVKRVEQFVRANLEAVLPQEEAARLINLSASYFSRAFKATKGVAYRDYVLDARVGHAKRLLLTTDQRICEIALKCGFYDQAHLTRSFTRATGVPPGAWRREMSDRAFQRGQEASTTPGIDAA
jgi:AraC family transcriptional regulator